MVFDVNQTEFNNEFQEKVWQIGKAVLPLEVTLSGINDPETREGCTQIYKFTQELLEDMYTYPAKYNHIRAVDYCVLIFDGLIKSGAVLDDGGLCWVIPAEKYNLEKHLSLLSVLGFSVIGNDENKVISNSKYPLFLKYWYALYQLATKRGVNRCAYPLSCDFRLFAKTYKRTLEDLLRTLSNRYRFYFQDLHNYVTEKGAKPESAKYYGRYRYLYQNDFVLILEQRPCILVPYGLKADWAHSIQRFLAEAEKQYDVDKLIAYIQKEIVLCCTCGNKNCGGHMIEIAGVPLPVAACHHEIGKWHMSKNMQDYIDDDIYMLKRMIDIRFKQIDNILNK